MSIPRPLAALALVAALAACEKAKDSSSSGAGDPASADEVGAGSAEEAARRFATAVAERDRAAAEKLLMPASACNIAPEGQRESCQESAAAMREQLPEVFDDFPEGATIAKVEKSKEPTPDPRMTMWSVYLEGEERPTGGVIVIDADGTFYAGYAIKKKEKAKTK